MPAPKKKPTILIIADDLGLLVYLGDLLARAGYQPWPARNRREALKLVDKLNLTIDLVIASSRTGKGVIEALTRGGKPPKLLTVEQVTRPERPEAWLGAVRKLFRRSDG